VVTAEHDRDPAGGRERKRRPLIRLTAGLAGLTGGGWLLSDALRIVVSDLGVSQTLLGNTAIAASIEAEKVGRLAVPARRGRPEIALGNLAGTIVHFVAHNAGVIALVKSRALDNTSLRLHLPVAVASTLLLAAGPRLGRLEGALLLALYLVYVGLSIAA
jgi:cation:H+ antiporter